MPAPLLIALIGVALLAVLVPLAIHQRRSLESTGTLDPGAATTQMPTTSRELPTPYTTSARSQPVSVARIAFGVFLGMWMFTITAAAIGALIMRAAFHNLNGR